MVLVDFNCQPHTTWNPMGRESNEKLSTCSGNKGEYFTLIVHRYEMIQFTIGSAIPKAQLLNLYENK